MCVYPPDINLCAWCNIYITDNDQYLMSSVCIQNRLHPSVLTVMLWIPLTLKLEVETSLMSVEQNKIHAHMRQNHINWIYLKQEKMARSSYWSESIANIDKFCLSHFSIRANTYWMYSQTIIDFYSQREHGTNHNYPANDSVRSEHNGDLAEHKCQFHSKMEVEVEGETIDSPSYCTTLHAKWC